MLIDCPECERSVSDRAAACPQCGFPIREWLAERQAAEAAAEAVASRERVGEVDCLYCQARGYVVFDAKLHGRGGFTWCSACGHTGRVDLCRASDGYYAVIPSALDGFLAGERHAGETGVDFLGTREPGAHTYPEAGKRTHYDRIPEWYEKLMPLLRDGAANEKGGDGEP